jgi:hypothetical protein
MEAIVYNLVTAALMVLMLNAGLALLPKETWRGRGVPWVAVGITVLAVAGVVTQLVWDGAMSAFDSNPANPGWWRIFTSVFVQNGGVAGTIYNLVTIAAVLVLVEWLWGPARTLCLFLAAVLLPGLISHVLTSSTSLVEDPRNYAGSSGVTYCLAATLAGVLLLRASTARQRLLAVAAPIVGLATWFLQDNAHGLVVAYGFVFGLVGWAVARPRVDATLRQ